MKALNSVAALGRDRERLIGRPPLANSPRKQGFVKAEHFCPLRHASAVASKLDIHVAFGVPLLRADVGPAAVVRRIPKRAVDSVKRAALWAFAHVRQKLLKLEPAVANGDPYTAVLVEFAAPRVEAPTNHVYPCVVRWRGHAADCVAVGQFVVSTSAPDAAIQAATGAAWAGPHQKFVSANKACALFHRQILRPNKFQGQPLRGLTLRRQAEHRQCLGAP